MISRSHESTIDLDLELAAKQDAENPVYYVQYVHARIAVDPAPRRTGRVEAALARDAGRGRAQRLRARADPQAAGFPGEVREATERRAPHRIATYALELGQAFAAFYRDSPVLKEPDADVQAFRHRAFRRVPAYACRRARVCSASPLRSPCRCSTRPRRYGPARARPVRPRGQPRDDPLQRPALRVRRRLAAAHVRGDVRDHRRPRGARRAARRRTSSAAT